MLFPDCPVNHSHQFWLKYSKTVHSVVRECMVIKNASFKLSVFWPEMVLRVYSET